MNCRTVAEAPESRTQPAHYYAGSNGFEDREGHRAPFASSLSGGLRPPDPLYPGDFAPGYPYSNQAISGAVGSRLSSHGAIVCSSTDHGERRFDITIEWQGRDVLSMSMNGRVPASA